MAKGGGGGGRGGGASSGDAPPSKDRLSKMNKAQRIDAARRYFDTLEEYEYWAAAGSLASDFNISFSDASEIIIGRRV